MAYLFITHDLATVRAISDKIAVMFKGAVVRYGQKSDVLEPPFDDYTDLLLSSVPEMELELAGKGHRTSQDGKRRELGTARRPVGLSRWPSEEARQG